MTKIGTLPDRWWLVLITGIALGLRLGWVNRIPSGISHDELDYYLEGKFLALTGMDLTGSRPWWVVTPMQTGTITAELTSLFYMPLAGWFPSNLFTAKTTPAIFGAALGLLMYGLIRRLTGGNRRAALLAALLTAVNPWSIVYSRTGYEVTLALTWYTLAATAFLWIGANPSPKARVGWWVTSLLALCMGYYSYHGFKFLAPFLAGVTVWAWWPLVPRLSRRQKLATTGAFMGVACLLMVTSAVNPLLRQRQNEMVWLDNHALTETVNLTRKQALSPAVAAVMENKATALVKHMLRVYMGFFSWERLFLTAGDNYNLSISEHGYFYLIESLFIFIGVVWAVRHRRAYWLLGMLVIAPLPSIIHVGISYGIRSSLAIVPLVGFSALGLDWLWTRWGGKGMAMAGLVLGLSVGYFGYVYVIRYGLLSADQYMLYNRLASGYILRLPQESKVTVITADPYLFFRDYLFYGNLISPENARALQAQFRGGLTADYTWGQVLVTADCKRLRETWSGVLVADAVYMKGCEAEQGAPVSLDQTNLASIGSPLDSREYFRVYRDPLCQKMILSPYVHLTSPASLAVERAGNEEFCRTWLFKPL